MPRSTTPTPAAKPPVPPTPAVPTNPYEAREALHRILEALDTATDAELAEVTPYLRMGVNMLTPAMRRIAQREVPALEVWTVLRPDNFGVYVYADEHRAEQYRALHDGASVDRQTVMNDSAAGQFYIDSVGEDE